MTTAPTIPFGPYKRSTLDRLPSAYILSLIAPTRLGPALPAWLEDELNAEFARRRRLERKKAA